MLKKFLKFTFLTIGIIFCSQFATVEKVFAENVYVGTITDASGNIFDYYVDPAGFSPAFGYPVYDFDGVVLIVWKNSKNGAFPKRSAYVTFRKFDGVWYFSGPFDDSNGSSMVTRSKVATNIFNIVYPRMQKMEEEEKRQAAAEEKRYYDEFEETLRKEQNIEVERERNFNNLIAEGDKFYIAKDYENAKNSYQKARNNDNETVEHYCDELIKKGDLFYKEKNFVLAIDYFRKAFVMGSNYASSSLYFSLVEAGKSAQDNKNFDKAIDYYNEAINLKPKRESAYLWLGSIYSNTEQYHKAIENYSKALQNSPNNALAYLLRANDYAILENYEQAISDYTKSIEFNFPDLAIPYYRRGLCYSALGKKSKAKKDFEKVFEINNKG